MKKYLILGKSGAGSLIPEFLFTELKITYDIQFVSKEELVKSTSKGYNPLGKIPVLILPDGTEIFESLAIVNYITTNYPGLSPTKESTDYFQYWRMLSLLSSTLYSGYHRQHHANDYVNEIGFTSLKEKAIQEQSIIYDYIEQNLKYLKVFFNTNWVYVIYLCRNYLCYQKLINFYEFSIIKQYVSA
mgnify:CR=1 FL=1